MSKAEILKERHKNWSGGGRLLRTLLVLRQIPGGREIPISHAERHGFCWLLHVPYNTVDGGGRIRRDEFDFACLDVEKVGIGGRFGVRAGGGSHVVDSEKLK